MRILLHYATLAGKQVLRHRVRSLLTIAGVTAGMFLFTAVTTLQESLEVITREGAGDSTLVVYRENRFCPSTSRLPEHYLAEIQRIPGVVEAIPVQIVVNNCGASLDVITFRGVPPKQLRRFNPDLEIVTGSFDDWTGRSDGALIGEHFAARRGLQPGDQFEAVGIRVKVSGIIRSPSAQDQSVAYVPLAFLQQSSRFGLGVVTQFSVRVEESADPDEVAVAIDQLFQNDTAPTDTKPEKAFFAQTAKDLIEMVGFTRWLGYAAVIAVVALVANALLLVVRGRVQENAVLQTIGFSRVSIAVMMLCEGAVLGLLGGLCGSGAAWAFFEVKRFTLGNEGLTLAIQPSPGTIFGGFGIAILLGLIASLWPAAVATRLPIIASLRAA
ncbi:MAG: ABC transporter permease [Verrucomicrobiales bacterium]|jgi:putative ABC transport system permease protein|nr:ABC transporter permease [Verrucomicrobiales bacterium]